MVPWSLSDQIWIRTPCFCFWKLFVFPCGFSAKMTCAFLAYQKGWRNYQNQTLFFRVRKTTLSSKFLIRLRFQGYSCKSGVSIFAWGGSLEFTITVLSNHLIQFEMIHISYFSIWFVEYHLFLCNKVKACCANSIGLKNFVFILSYIVRNTILLYNGWTIIAIQK